MPKINLLSEDLINKIAAGEVIERPASVVKELIENSLDAQATKIKIEIKDSGKKLIRITDNGEGMDEEDAKKSILRHATSKIRDDHDLFAIQTLGFRGEALASVAAVSQLSIITKPRDKVEGFNLVVEAGSIISSGVIAAEPGTIIEVGNLFFNTPARKKFLKTDAVELRHIIEVVTHYALINPRISFRLLHENHELLNSPAVEDLRSNIASIYGLRLAKDLLEVDYKDEYITISGYVAKPQQARNDKNQQALFVNNRWVKNNDVSKAVDDAFHSMLMVNKHSVFVLNLELDPEKIDVNVHPQKSLIKIEQKEKVAKAVITAVRETLEKNNLIPVVDFEFEQQLTFGRPKYSFEASEQKVLPTEETGPVKEEVAIKEEVASYQPKPEAAKFPPMKILGQVHKTFFVAETTDGVLFIDQHVVQERILYERFMKQLMNRQVATQMLLKKEILELSPSEKARVLENKEKLAELGFILEHFGENTFVLKTVPAVFGKVQPKEMVYELLYQLEEKKNKLEVIQEEIITRMACRASVKAGDTMTILEIQGLLGELNHCQFPYTCPHGRSIVIKVSVDDLEKMFKRK